MSTLLISREMLPWLLEPGTEIHYPDGRIVTVGAFDWPGVETLVGAKLTGYHGQGPATLVELRFDDGNDAELAPELSCTYPEGWRCEDPEA